MYYLGIFYNEVFYRPLLGALVFLTWVLPWHDLGFAVIALTVLIKLVIFPLTHKMLKTQRVMKELEPEIKKLYEDKKNKEEQAKALMELYKSHGINPLSGFLSLFIQLPLLIALYQVFWKGVPFKTEEIYSFLSVPADINTLFLGFISLVEPSVGMALLAGVSQYAQAKFALPPQDGAKSKNDMSRMMQTQMVYVFPILIFFIAYKLPAAVPLYWTAMNVFAIVHEAIVRRSASYAGGKTNTS